MSSKAAMEAATDFVTGDPFVEGNQVVVDSFSFGFDAGLLRAAQIAESINGHVAARVKIANLIRAEVSDA